MSSPSLAHHLVLYLVLLSLVGVNEIRALCLQCGRESGAMCLDETRFAQCFGGLPSTTALGNCPAGSVCYDNAAVCGNALTVTADCAGTTTPPPSTVPVVQSCYQCIADSGRYACMNATAFGLCLGTGAVVPNYVYTCPTGQWCDVMASQAAGVSGTTCTSDPRRISCNLYTPTPAEIANQRCVSYQTLNVNLPMPQDTTCRKYIKCYQYNGQFRGQLFECPGTTLFNPRQLRCQSPGTFTCVVTD